MSTVKSRLEVFHKMEEKHNLSSPLSPKSPISPKSPMSQDSVDSACALSETSSKSVKSTKSDKTKMSLVEASESLRRDAKTPSGGKKGFKKEESCYKHDILQHIILSGKISM